jgi:hypothetical protein
MRFSVQTWGWIYVFCARHDQAASFFGVVLVILRLISQEIIYFLRRYIQGEKKDAGGKSRYKGLI